MSERICGICDEKLTNDDEIVACRECDELYHLECFEASGGCANPKCKNYKAPSLSLSLLSQDDGEYDEFDEYDNYEENFTVSYANERDDPFYEQKIKKEIEEKWEFDENYQNNATKINKENPDDYNESYLKDGYGNYYSPEDDETYDNESPSKLSKILAYIFCGIVALGFLIFYIHILYI